MPSLFPGFGGIIAGLGIVIATWLLISLATHGTAFEFDAQGEKGAFEKLLAIYLDIAKFVLGLAAGSIVLLVGSSTLRPLTPGGPTKSFASPLFLLALSIIYGILFMVFLIFNYEHYRHHPNTGSYTRSKYVRNQALGFGALACFCLGYVWLIFSIA